MRGDDGFDGFALGIAGEVACGDAAQHFAHLGRAGKRVLVEVEAEGVAAAERRVILLHRPDARARTRGAVQDCGLSATGSPHCARDLLLQAGADGFGVADEAFGFGEQCGLGPECAQRLR